MQQLKYLRGDTSPESWLQQCSRDGFVGIVPLWVDGWIPVCLWYEGDQPHLFAADIYEELWEHSDSQRLWFLLSMKDLYGGTDYVRGVAKPASDSGVDP